MNIIAKFAQYAPRGMHREEGRGGRGVDLDEKVCTPFITGQAASKIAVRSLENSNYGVVYRLNIAE